MLSWGQSFRLTSPEQHKPWLVTARNGMPGLRARPNRFTKLGFNIFGESLRAVAGVENHLRCEGMIFAAGQQERIMVVCTPPPIVKLPKVDALH
mmetsp:Transcript_4070/g.6425  ORF Transcript_4070/g.6425 Transcript_4070/m.6425 type:complete len:94 (-) Transcript_4070:484-765(-)